jgi:hypothetical protein
MFFKKTFHFVRIQFVRKDLDAKYEVLVNEARKMKLSNTEKWWRNAVLWEFCELDRTHDK